MELLNFETACNLGINLIAAIGEFDGLHIGHRQLLLKCDELKKIKNEKTALITFFPHPAFIIGNVNKDYILSSNDAKIELLKNSSIDYLIIINFTQEFAELSPQKFIDEYLIRLNITDLVVGFDFRFGYNGSGKADDIHELSNKSMSVYIIDEYKIDDQKVSSTLIRKKIKEDFNSSLKYFNHPYVFISSVVKGSGIGIKLGFPTINLAYSNEWISLKNGVYAVEVIYNNNKYNGIMNVGHNPTCNFQNEIRTEIHIIGFDKSIYGEKVLVRVLYFIRPEITFNNQNELINQIKIDIKNVNDNMDIYKSMSHNSY